MRDAAISLGKKILPLPQEWWDFREEEIAWGKFQPLREADLHSYQRVIDVDEEGVQKILNGEIPKEIQPALNQVCQMIGIPSRGITTDPKLTN